MRARRTSAVAIIISIKREAGADGGCDNEVFMRYSFQQVR